MKKEKLRLLVQEGVRQALREQEIEQAADELEKLMGDALGDFEKAYDANEEEAKQEVEDSEETINEAIGAVAIIGFMLALPKILEIMVKGVSKLVKGVKKVLGKTPAKDDKEGQEDMAKKIIDGLHKWHKGYIYGLQMMLKYTGIFKKAKIKQPAAQKKAAEMLYYTIVAGLALYSGIGAVSAFKGAMSGAAHGGSFSLSAFEAAMATVKSGEVSSFLGELGLEASAAATDTAAAATPTPST